MIRRVRVLLLGLVGVLVLGIATAGVASAEMVLPSFLNAEAGTGSAGAMSLQIEGGATFKALKAKVTYAFNAGSHQLGTYTITLETVTEGGESCLSLGGTAGTVVVSGEWHLVLEVIGTSHLWLIDLLLPSTDPHVECPKAAVKLFLLLGSILALIEPGAGVATKEFKLVLEAPNGVQKEKTYENNKGELPTDTLETSQEGGKQKKAGLVASSTVVTFAKANEINN